MYIYVFMYIYIYIFLIYSYWAPGRDPGTAPGPGPVGWDPGQWDPGQYVQYCVRTYDSSIKRYCVRFGFGPAMTFKTHL